MGQILLASLTGLAWLVQPEANESTLAMSLLMFLRFVPIFVLLGSRWGRTGVGAVLGVAVFFALMGAEALSFTAWDATILSTPVKAVKHATTLANLQYLLGAVSIILCVAVIFFINRSTAQSTGLQARMLLQIMAAVQTVLFVELAYLGYRNGWVDELPRQRPAHTAAQPHTRAVAPTR